MTQQPIAVFDSSAGGLSVLQTLIQTLPGHRYVYFADTAYKPYGLQSIETVTDRIQKLKTWLLEQHNPIALVLACFSATSGVLKTEQFDTVNKDLPLINPINTVSSACQSMTHKDIGLLATPLTIKTGLFEGILTAENPEKRFHPVSCYGLAELIESGDIKSHKFYQELSKTLENQPSLNDIDAAILGCTHYPHIKTAIAEILQPPIEIIDPSQVITEALITQFNLQSGNPEKTTIDYFVTGEPDDFKYTTSQLALSFEADHHPSYNTITSVSL